MSEPLYMIAGIGSDATSFDRIGEHLSGVCECIGWNLPGYGGTALRTGYSFPDLTQWLLEDLDTRGYDKAHFLGHSIGGMVAQDFALTHPDRTASVILSGTTHAFGGKDDSFKRAFLDTRLKPLDEGKSMADLAKAFVPQLMGPSVATELVEAAINNMAGVPQAAYREAMQCLVTFDRREDIRTLSVPALLIAGELDQNAPLKTMTKMAGLIADARLETLPGIGHMAPLEVPERFADIVRNFLERMDT